MASIRINLFTICLLLLSSIAVIHAQSGDAGVLQTLKKALNSPTGWTDPNPCKWNGITCDRDDRVTRIQLKNQKLTGSLPQDLASLTELQNLEVQFNQISGPLPSLAGLSKLVSLIVSNNNFSYVPSDFFNGMTSLSGVYLDCNPFQAWVVPDGIKAASGLQVFSADSSNLTGSLPEFFGSNNFPSLTTLHLSFNYFVGPLPSSFAGSSISSLWLNGQKSSSRLNGSVSILQNMTSLGEVWLHGNSFTGPLPDFTNSIQLQNLSLRDNSLTGPVPASLIGLKSLVTVNLTNNLLQGETPEFASGIKVDLKSDRNSFCSDVPGKECDPRVNTLLAIAENVGYPVVFAQSWRGNDPCVGSWVGITCNNGNITVVNFRGMGLKGTISPGFSQLGSLQRLILSNNNLNGAIPNELATLPNLLELDVSNNQIYGKIPSFKSNINVITSGNPNIGKDGPPPSTGNGSEPSNNKKKHSTGAVVGSVFGGVCVIALSGVLIFLHRTKRKRSRKIRVRPPRDSGSDNALKITIDGSSETHSSIAPSDIDIVDASHMVISIQVLRSVTNNFSEDNILGRGGFGTVYGGELHDGTKIAVKRMEWSATSEKGLDEFKSEISVLTKVRHRHLVTLLGYCLDGNERLLVYEYMPQGTLSRFLFQWKRENLEPLEWTKRLTIALDVARGVEYLHGLAHQSFIHRDLKPSNILLGDDMRAKVADFGLVRLAPDGKASIATKLAGTFGYLAPEYAVTGRVTTKIDVFSFGVILMELITGRKALDEMLPEDTRHLVPWFRRMLISKETFRRAIDPYLRFDEETLASIATVAELAGHCSAREPSQRPDMGHVVNVLSSLAEMWRPSERVDPDDVYGIDYDMSLSQAVKKWQALEGMTGLEGLGPGLGTGSYLVGSNENTETSVAARPAVFTVDGR